MTDIPASGPSKASARQRLGVLQMPAAPPEGSRLVAQTAFGPNPGALHMYLYVPDGLAAPAPLVVILHGCGQTAQGYDHGAGWTALADRLGFAVLAPEQTRLNNMNSCFNWFQPGDITRGEGEAASIHQMIRKALADHPLDPRRVFITGLSAGGAMTTVLLALYPEMFAGGAVIAGLPFGTAANVPEALNSMRHASAHTPEAWAARVRHGSRYKGPWPRLSIWHGDADTTVDISNQDALIAQWTALHGLPLAPSETRQDHGHLRRSWKNADGTVMLEALTLSGLGHGTPIHSGGGREQGGHAGPHFLESGISSSARIAAFWGLAPARVKAQPPEVLPRAQALPDVEASRGMSKVIHKALKIAGLLKR